MICKKAYFLSELKGKIGPNMYARDHANPELIIIQRRPERKLSRGQKRDPEQVKNQKALLEAKEKAKHIYNTPELRARWEARYKELDAQCKKKQSRAINGGKALKDYGGYELPYSLWPWIYGECLREAHKNKISVSNDA